MNTSLILIGLNFFDGTDLFVMLTGYLNCDSGRYIRFSIVTLLVQPEYAIATS